MIFLIYVFLANGFEEIEAITTIDILKRADINVRVVGTGNKLIKGAYGVKVETDILSEDVDFSDMEGIVLPGGLPGVNNLFKELIVKKAIEHCFLNKKLIAAICAAPSILGRLGFLKGKVATCYPGFEKKLLGATVSSDSVCLSDNILTAKGPGVALQFSLKIVETLKGKKLCDSLIEDLQMTY